MNLHKNHNFSNIHVFTEGNLSVIPSISICTRDVKNGIVSLNLRYELFDAPIFRIEFGRKEDLFTKVYVEGGGEKSEFL